MVARPASIRVAAFLGVLIPEAGRGPAIGPVAVRRTPGLGAYTTRIRQKQSPEIPPQNSSEIFSEISSEILVKFWWNFDEIQNPPTFFPEKMAQNWVPLGVSKFVEFRPP